MIALKKHLFFYHFFLPKSLNNPWKGEEKRQPINMIGNFITNFLNVKEPFNEDDM
jgi:hypothetical protein